MAGIFPRGGVPADQTQNGLTNPDVAVGCSELWYAPRCNPKFDPFAANAVMSEIINAVNCADLVYDCNRLDNLSRALCDPVRTVNRICASVAAKRALAACTLSTDPGQGLTLGLNGQAGSDELHYFHAPFIFQNGTPLESPPEIDLSVPQNGTLLGQLALNVTNAHRTEILKGLINYNLRYTPLRLAGPGKVTIAVHISIDGGVTYNPNRSNFQVYEFAGVDNTHVLNFGQSHFIGLVGMTIPALDTWNIVVQVRATVDAGQEFQPGSSFSAAIGIGAFGVAA